MGLEPDLETAKLGHVEPRGGGDDEEDGGEGEPDEAALEGALVPEDNDKKMMKTRITINNDKNDDDDENALIPGVRVDDRVVGRPEDEAQRDGDHAKEGAAQAVQGVVPL